MSAAAIQAELAIIRARMQAIETTLPAGQCPLWATDLLYGQQEALRAALEDLVEVHQ
jgi:hypothetical protein